MAARMGEWLQRPMSLSARGTILPRSSLICAIVELPRFESSAGLRVGHRRARGQTLLLYYHSAVMSAPCLDAHTCLSVDSVRLPPA